MEVEREAARGRDMERKGEDCNKQVQLRMHRRGRQASVAREGDASSAG